MKIASQSDEVIFSLRVEDNVWHGYAEHVADWYKFAENSKALFKIPSRDETSWLI